MLRLQDARDDVALTVLCRGEQLAKQIAAVDQQYRPGTTKHALALQEVKQRHAAEVQTMQSGEAEVGRVIDSGINALVRLLVDLPNSRRAETEADKVRASLPAACGVPCNAALALVRIHTAGDAHQGAPRACRWASA